MPESGENLIESLPLNEFHGVETGAALLSLGIDGHNVRVMKLGRRLRFAVESDDGGAGHSKARWKHFERHAAVQRNLPGFAQSQIRHARRILRDSPKGLGPGTDAADPPRE